MLIQVLYSSRSIYPRGDLTDLDILKTAIDNNALLNITGALLRDERRFLQILEGQTDKVLPLLQSIQTDPRHFDMQILFQRQIDTRIFGDWSMGYAEITQDIFASFADLSETYEQALDDRLTLVLPSIQAPAL